MTPLPRLAVGFACAVALIAAPAAATEIATGAADGPYQLTLCPPLKGALDRARLEYRCVPSDSARETLQRIAAAPRQLGYVPLDSLLVEGPQLAGAKAFTRVRTGDVYECLFAVARNGDLKTYGDLAANAQRLRFVLPPKASASAASFGLVRQGDAAGLGRAGAVLHAAHIEEAVKLALSAEDTVAVFLAPADPGSEVFKSIPRLGGHVIAMLDRAILRQQIGGEKVYFAEETPIAQARWLKAGRRIVTACTPTVLVTGAPDRIGDPRARQDHADMIQTVQALRPEALLPRQGTFKRLWTRTREVSGASVERLLGLSERARERSRPYLDQAQEATGKAVEATKPALERARQWGAEAYEKARQKGREVFEQGTEKPADPPKQN